MFSSLFKRPLKLVLDERKLHFRSLVDFEFCLASRTEVPAGRVSEFVQLPAPELKREATKIRGVEKRFVDVLSRAMKQPDSIGRHMRELGHKVFSLDHEWRAIVAALNQQDASFGEYKKMALVKYLQYLGARQDILQSLYVEKIERGASEELVNEADFKETVIFDLSPHKYSRTDTRSFERLPKGETVAIKISAGRDMEVLLSSNRFRLVAGREFSLVDDNGAGFSLRAGKNVVGRDAKSEIVIDARYRDVSRTHVVIEPYNLNTALITDLSSHGTFVPIRNLQPGLT